MFPGQQGASVWRTNKRSAPLLLHSIIESLYLKYCVPLSLTSLYWYICVFLAFSKALPLLRINGELVWEGFVRLERCSKSWKKGIWRRPFYCNDTTSLWWDMEGHRIHRSTRTSHPIINTSFICSPSLTFSACSSRVMTIPQLEGFDLQLQL